jgi:hypothetical protein
MHLAYVIVQATGGSASTILAPSFDRIDDDDDCGNFGGSKHGAAMTSIYMPMTTQQTGMPSDAAAEA